MLVVDEQLSGQQYQDLTQSEFAEFVYRISSHIYDEDNYQLINGKLNHVPQAVKDMFDATPSAKFKEALQLLLATDKKLKYP